MSIAWKALNDVQWMNIVNHDHCHESSDKDDAINLVFKMTEAKVKEANEPAIDQMERELRAAHRLIACFERLQVGCQGDWSGYQNGNGTNVGDAIERARKQYYKVKGKV